MPCSAQAPRDGVQYEAGRTGEDQTQTVCSGSLPWGLASLLAFWYPGTASCSAGRWELAFGSSV